MLLEEGAGKAAIVTAHPRDATTTAEGRAVETGTATAIVTTENTVDGGSMIFEIEIGVPIIEGRISLATAVVGGPEGVTRRVASRAERTTERVCARRLAVCVSILRIIYSFFI